MSGEALQITIGGMVDETIVVNVRGSLLLDFQSLGEHLARVEGVLDARVVRHEPMIIVTCKQVDTRETYEQVRRRIRDRCRTYVKALVGGSRSSSSISVELIEDTLNYHY